jgi:D-alanyl-D-alanine carboxypeptidase/lipoprotein-anchoring transpeptidase ErfK/SrfK
MGGSDHSFDWKGFTFAAKICFAVTIVGIGANYGWLYAEAYFFPTTTSALVAVQTTPLVPVVLAATLSTTTPQRTLNALTIADVVPTTGKFIAADLVNMELYLYQDGTSTAEYPILTKGKPGTPYETPSGVYTVLTKEVDHYNAGEQVHMPYSMEFYGNYFIHGWPTYNDGTPVASTYSGGCIRLSTDDAAKVYAFADKGTGVFVYDTGAATSAPPLMVSGNSLPPLSASAYLVADVDTGDVYAEQNGQEQLPIASVTKLMTALVANETIMFDHEVTVPRGELQDVDVATDTAPETFVIGDLLYPLLMESNNNIADTLAQYYGTGAFVDWMNSQAKALDMASTTFADASGVSAEDVSTPEDLYRLAVYLANKKSFVWKITRTPQKTITAGNGSSYTFANFNEFSDLSSFVGGKVGHTTPAQDTMVSVFSMPVDGQQRRIAVIVLDSDDYTTDTQKLAAWFDQSAATAANTACASCAEPQYKQIQL